MTRDDTFSVCDWSVVTYSVLSLAVNLLSPFSSLTLFDQFQWVDWPVVVPNSVQSFNFPKLKFDSLSSEHFDFCKFISSLDSFVPCHGQQFHSLHNNSSWGIHKSWPSFAFIASSVAVIDFISLCDIVEALDSRCWTWMLLFIFDHSNDLLHVPMALRVTIATQWELLVRLSPPMLHFVFA